jgi:hypothetical protein
MLYGRLLGSPHPHARPLDRSLGSQKLPGVARGDRVEGSGELRHGESHVCG